MKTFVVAWFNVEDGILSQEIIEAIDADSAKQVVFIKYRNWSAFIQALEVNLCKCP